MEGEGSSTDALAPILRVASECAETFRLVAASDELSPNDIHDLKNQHARFQIWLSTSKTFESTSQNAGPDYNLQNVLLSMLQRLSYKVRAIVATPRPILVPINDHDSPNSLILDSDSGLETDEEISRDRHPTLAFVDSIISRLYRFTDFIEPKESINEEQSLHEAFDELSLGDTTDLEKAAREYLREECPSFYRSPILLERHLNASKVRQKRLHNSRSEIAILDKASKLFASHEEPTKTTPQKAPERWSKMAFPPAPIRNVMDKSECPYCGREYYSGSDSKPPDLEYVEYLWKCYVIQDIIPYVCLFPGCDPKTPPFDSVEEWLRHMKDHWSDYFCQFPGHEEVMFSSCDQLASHLTAAHSESIPRHMAAAIAGRGRSASSTIFMHLLLEWNQDVKDNEDITACIFCKRHIRDVAGEPGANLRMSDISQNNISLQVKDAILEHVLHHLENIALLSLHKPDTEIAAKKSIHADSSKSGAFQDIIGEPNDFGTLQNAREKFVTVSSVGKNKLSDSSSYSPPPSAALLTEDTALGAKSRVPDKLISGRGSMGGDILYLWYCCSCGEGPYNCAYHTGCASCCNHTRCGGCTVVSRLS